MATEPPRIEDYGFGRIVIDGTRYSNDVIIYPERVDDSWWRDQGHLLQMVDLDGVLQANPDVLVVGTGAYGRMRLADGVEEALAQRDIDVVAAQTDEAVERYNELAPGRRTVAALHLTC
ncbi:MAG: MTH938/NDUFAF3 family protein [Armatimonadota bacterium]|nr:MTH938/NDUFAF3 family protein [Armatimonadota bacterium]